MLEATKLLPRLVLVKCSIWLTWYAVPTHNCCADLCLFATSEPSACACLGTHLRCVTGLQIAIQICPALNAQVLDAVSAVAAYCEPGWATTAAGVHTLNYHFATVETHLRRSIVLGIKHRWNRAVSRGGEVYFRIIPGLLWHGRRPGHPRMVHWKRVGTLLVTSGPNCSTAGPKAIASSSVLPGSTEIAGSARLGMLCKRCLRPTFLLIA